jgi:hypothetical protein
MPAVAELSEALLSLAMLADTEDILEDSELSAGSYEDVVVGTKEPVMAEMCMLADCEGVSCANTGFARDRLRRVR